MYCRDFSIGEKIRIVNVSILECGELWSNDDIVEVEDVNENFIEVWDKNKRRSEFINEDELRAVEKLEY